MIVKDRFSYIIVIRNEKTSLSVSYDHGLLECYIYFGVIVLVKSYVYYKFIVTIAIRLYFKKFEVYKVIDFTFTRKNLHFLEDYIYYNLQLCLL